jgi:hypothetical protein
MSHAFMDEGLKEEEKGSTTISLKYKLIFTISIRNVILPGFGSFVVSKSVFSLSLEKSNGTESLFHYHTSFDYLNNSSLQNETSKRKYDKAKSKQSKAKQRKRMRIV